MVLEIQRTAHDYAPEAALAPVELIYSLALLPAVRLSAPRYAAGLVEHSPPDLQALNSTFLI